MNPWEEILRRIKTIIDRQTYNKWFSRTRLVSFKGKCLDVAVSDPLSREWIQSNFMPLIDECALEIFGTGTRVQLSVINDIGEREPSSARATPSSSWNSSFDPSQSFENFVVGDSNRLAHSAALAVSSSPAVKHNPLFLYGGSGVGKTHLIHATANRIKAMHPRLKRTYISSENFMNEMVDSIKKNVTFEFRKKYRGTDVLFIDDFHYIAGKEKTQVELLHTINNLMVNKKQVVISSHVSPIDLPIRDESLRSRLGCGLVADIQTPDVDTTRDIIALKARESSIILDDASIEYLSRKISSNIRYLQGCLNKMQAISSLSGGNVLTLDIAKRAVQELIKSYAENITIGSIQKLVADFFKLTLHELKAKDNSRRVTMPRQVAMYLCKKVAAKSYPEIGRKFGGKHHSTVIHAVHKIEKRRAESKEFNSMINNFIGALK